MEGPFLGAPQYVSYSRAASMFTTGSSGICSSAKAYGGTGNECRTEGSLDRAILNKDWYATEHRSGARQIGHGHLHIAAPAPGTSITCVECGYVDKDTQVSQSMFVCTNCGYEAYADLNAAEEILERGIIQLALAGGTPVTTRQDTNLGPASVGTESKQQSRNIGVEAGMKLRTRAPLRGPHDLRHAWTSRKTVRKLGPSRPSCLRDRVPATHVRPQGLRD